MSAHPSGQQADDGDAARARELDEAEKDERKAGDARHAGWRRTHP